jgi:hypothetical protein
MVTVHLRRTYGYQGKYYGPGPAVAVPAGLAASMGFKAAAVAAPVVAVEEAADDPLPAIARLADAIKKKSAVDIRAMQARDDRVGAQPIYTKALESAK